MSPTASSSGVGLPPPKQIRFVNNEGRPPAKRRRVESACRTCRRRKIKCDGKKPLCNTCLDNGHTCLGYTDPPYAQSGSRNSEALRNGDDGNSPEEVETRRSISSLNGSPQTRRSEPARNFEPAPTNGRTGGDVEQHESENDPNAYVPNSNFSNDARTVHTESRRVPYFRYFGPTAIVPGFKAMVVSVREHRRSVGATSAPSTVSPGSAGYSDGGTSTFGGLRRHSLTYSEPRAAAEIPVYDPTDPLPVSPLIKNLMEVFFIHLGCNFPFLRREKVIRMVEEKSLEPILVDAICSLAARFSDHPLLAFSHEVPHPKSEYGQVFAQRAKAAVIDTFPCPTVAATQACLLLAYEGFGANQDSALWMYTGCAIRMAVDLGLQKLDGVRYQRVPHGENSMDKDSPEGVKDVDPIERRAVEQEHIDTLWAVFMLDRVISSGTGRPVTLRDEDFELSFPEVTSIGRNGWPAPFPALIRIIHLYGRVSDLLNNIRNVKDVNTDKMAGLAAMESDLTKLYQKLDPRLTFNAVNFQHYVKSGEGSNFILLHFWFHTLIMLLHQPMLLHSFEGRIQQLLPNSHELSMSSAKTIADILAFAELIDPKSFIGNPFTSQPMYIAACAFLMETAAHTASQPTSGGQSPQQGSSTSGQSQTVSSNGNHGVDTKQASKHTLLAAAANQNYQRCYKALQQLQTYWAGTKYILTALDQKAEGIWDPETYTSEEMESTKLPRPSIPQDWKNKLPVGLAARSPAVSSIGNGQSPKFEMPNSPALNPSQAIGWSLTGTTNSPNSNLTFLYQSLNGETHSPAPSIPYDPIRQSFPESTRVAPPASHSPYAHLENGRNRTDYVSQHSAVSQRMPPPASRFNTMSPDVPSTSVSDAEMLLNLQQSPAPYSQSHAHTPSYDSSRPSSLPSPAQLRQDLHSAASGSTTTNNNNYDFAGSSNVSPYTSSAFPTSGLALGGLGAGDMMLESQEIDMSALNGEMIPWLEYLPDVVGFFDTTGTAAAAAGGGNMG